MTYKYPIDEWKESSKYAALHWRNFPEKQVETLEDFLFWLEYDCEDFPESELNKVKALVNEYLGRDMNKIKTGESELLAQWIKATKKQEE